MCSQGPEVNVPLCIRSSAHKLPFCGPLEGLALTYVLREQGAFVTVNSTMLHRFESTLTHHCPQECEEQFFEPVILSDAAIDTRLAQLFGAPRSQDIAVLEIRYKSQAFIETLLLKPGTEIGRAHV